MCRQRATPPCSSRSSTVCRRWFKPCYPTIRTCSWRPPCSSGSCSTSELNELSWVTSAGMVLRHQAVRAGQLTPLVIDLPANEQEPDIVVLTAGPPDPVEARCGGAFRILKRRKAVCFCAAHENPATGCPFSTPPRESLPFVHYFVLSYLHLQDISESLPG